MENAELEKEMIGIQDKEELIALVGNPNVGKSVVFSHLTGKYREVSNYPGTTVDLSIGKGDINGKKRAIVDTPGADSLTPMSEDQKVARNILLGSNPSKIIQVADAKNLKRSLMMFLQLSELEIPTILNLNMIDEARTKRIQIDSKNLSKELGVPVCETVAPEGKGIKNLKGTLDEAKTPNVKPDYPNEIEKSIDKLRRVFDNRGTSLLFLMAPKEMKDFIKNKYGKDNLENAEKIVNELKKKFSRDLSYVITMAIREKAQEIYKRNVVKEKNEKTPIKEKISELTLQPITGIPIFIGVMYLFYQFVGNFGAQIIVDYLEGFVFGEYINPFIRNIFYSSLGDNFISEILVGEFGVLTVGLAWSIALILPIITTFFLAFSFLEDCGYIPRLASMTDKLFRKIGLNGKAVLPMILGLGCDSMATVTTRTLDTKKERIIATLMLALGIPCSAQLGIIFAVMSLVPAQYFYAWILVVVSQLILVAWLSSKIIPGERGDFIMELPPIRMPKFTNVLRKTYYKVKWFFKEVVPFFMFGTFIVSIAKITGFLETLVQSIRPVIHNWMGLPTDAAVVFVFGFIRRDFGAAGLLNMARAGLTNHQILVATVGITLFVPCVANFLVIIKERGLITALAILTFIIPYAFLVAGILHHALNIFGGVL